MVLKIATLVLYLLTAACAYGGYVSPQIMAFPSVMVLALPYLAVISAIATVIWFCAGAWVTGSIGILMFILCQNPLGMLFSFHSDKKASKGAKTFTLLTWNVCHGSDFGQPDYQGNRTFETILKENADVVCLQEMYYFQYDSLPGCRKATIDSLCSLYPYRRKFDSGDLMFLSKYPFEIIPAPERENEYWNARLARLSIDGHPVMLYNLHLTSFQISPKDQEFIEQIRGVKSAENSLKTFKHTIYSKLKASFPTRATTAEKVLSNLEVTKAPTIVCGDFNDVPASWTYRMFLKDGFKDAFTETNFWPSPTFHNNLLYFRIDQVFYRGDVRPLSVERVSVNSSDHYGLKATFEFLDPGTAALNPPDPNARY